MKVVQMSNLTFLQMPLFLDGLATKFFLTRSCIKFSQSWWSISFMFFNSFFRIQELQVTNRKLQMRMQSKGCVLFMPAHLSLSATCTHGLSHPFKPSAPFQVVTQHDVMRCNLSFAPLILETKNTQIKQKNTKHKILNRISCVDIYRRIFLLVCDSRPELITVRSVQQC